MICYDDLKGISKPNVLAAASLFLNHKIVEAPSVQLKLMMFLTLSVASFWGVLGYAQQRQEDQAEANQAPTNQAQGDVYLVYMLGIT